MKKINPILLSLASLIIGCKAIMPHKPANSAYSAVKGLHYSPSHESDINKGLSYIPSGTYLMGDSSSGRRSVTVSGFWMDATEVSNTEYKKFINWVRDSIAALQLNYYDVTAAGDTLIDWKRAANINYGSAEILSKLENILTINDRGRKTVDPKKLVYHMTGFDFKRFVLPENKDKPREQFMYSFEIPVYPDTLVWMRDFDYSNNEAMTRMYFSHPSYQNYPVVGVNWFQAMAYCNWRTMMLNNYLAEHNRPPETGFRLPTEAEWELAARAGRDSIFPWGKNSVNVSLTNTAAKKKKSFYLANIKDEIGDYTADGSLFPVRVDSYWPNDYGLYNMIGNVAEWTSSYYYPGSFNFQSQINPDVSVGLLQEKNSDLHNKVVKGGSWKDGSYFVRPGIRAYKEDSLSTSWIGFRCVINLSGDWK